jgi:Flp pilus assembly protein TadD
VPAGDPAVLDALRAEMLRLRGLGREFPHLEEVTRQLLALAPADAEATYTLAVARWRRGAREDAIALCRHAAELDPADERPRVLEGDIQVERGRTGGARLVWRQCIHDIPHARMCQARMQVDEP